MSSLLFELVVLLAVAFATNDVVGEITGKYPTDVEHSVLRAKRSYEHDYENSVPVAFFAWQQPESMPTSEEDDKDSTPTPQERTPSEVLYMKKSSELYMQKFKDDDDEDDYDDEEGYA